MKSFKQFLIENSRQGFSMDVESDGNFHDYYDSSYKAEIPYGYKLYPAKNVVWIGKEGETLRMDSSNVLSRQDNIFDHKKVSAVAKHILESDDRVTLETPPCHITILDSRDIAENLQEDVYGLEQNFTTGDDELDEILSTYDWEEYVEEQWGYTVDEVYAMMKECDDNQYGDCGSMYAILRDGNHRAQGAMASGEHEIFVHPFEYSGDLSNTSYAKLLI